MAVGASAAGAAGSAAAAGAGATSGSALTWKAGPIRAARCFRLVAVVWQRAGTVGERGCMGIEPTKGVVHALHRF